MSSHGARPQDPGWRKPSYCQGGECAEIAKIDGMFALRSNTDPGRVIRYTPNEWRALVKAIKADEFADLD
jgi:Domain of unknown function (DUF397)